MIRVGFFQFSPEFGEKLKNLNKVDRIIEKADADIVVLPELFAVGYTFTSKEEAKEYSETADDSITIKRMIEIAQKHKTNLYGSFIEREKSKIYHTGILATIQGKFTLYRKPHLYSIEKYLYSKGNTPFQVVKIPLKDGSKIKVGLMLNHDWFFPEVSRTLALQGARVLLQSVNLVLPDYAKVMAVRALENRVYTITCNRIGLERRKQYEYKFIGLSNVMNPDGEIVISSGKDMEEIKVVDIEEGFAADKTINDYNHIFKDRRPDLYIL